MRGRPIPWKRDCGRTGSRIPTEACECPYVPVLSRRGRPILTACPIHDPARFVFTDSGFSTPSHRAFVREEL
jgi:hypothetical protein